MHLVVVENGAPVRNADMGSSGHMETPQRKVLWIKPGLSCCMLDRSANHSVTMTKLQLKGLTKMRN